MSFCKEIKNNFVKINISDEYTNDELGAYSPRFQLAHKSQV